jgi:hypothetical protein
MKYTTSFIVSRSRIAVSVGLLCVQFAKLIDFFLKKILTSVAMVDELNDKLTCMYETVAQNCKDLHFRCGQSCNHCYSSFSKESDVTLKRMMGFFLEAGKNCEIIIAIAYITFVELVWFNIVF